MYLSSLLIDVGDNPDRPRPGRLWLRNLYHVHQRLCMAFPSASQISQDPDFLKPFKPENFDRKQIYVTRQADSGFLFRVDPLPGGRAVILVQSAIEPDWDYAFRNARHLLAAPPEMKSFDLFFTRGQGLRFRLLANPTKKVDTIKKKERQNYTKEELKEIKGRHGKRLPVPCATEIKEWRLKNPGKDARIFIDSQLFHWLASQGEKKGFSVKEESTTIQPGYIYVHKKKGQDDKGQRLRTVRYDGILRVTDADLIQDTVIRGLGPGKAYGLGLMSLAPP
jgi:CRISPR system Cascade subunit CasE